MIWFSYFYLGPRMVLLDVSEERHGGLRTYVAALSEDPRICMRARRADDALNQLVAYLRGLHEREAMRVTFWPEPTAPLAAAPAARLH